MKVSWHTLCTHSLRRWDYGTAYNDLNHRFYQEKHSVHASTIPVISMVHSIFFYILSGLTALHQAVLDGNFKAVRLLLKHGANVNQLDEDQWTPLHAACADRMSNIAR